MKASKEKAGKSEGDFHVVDADRDGKVTLKYIEMFFRGSFIVRRQ
jgi:hypothetical protein